MILACRTRCTTNCRGWSFSKWFIKLNHVLVSGKQWKQQKMARNRIEGGNWHPWWCTSGYFVMNGWCPPWFGRWRRQAENQEELGKGGRVPCSFPSSPQLPLYSQLPIMLSGVPHSPLYFLAFSAVAFSATHCTPFSLTLETVSFGLGNYPPLQEAEYVW